MKPHIVTEFNRSHRRMGRSRRRVGFTLIEVVVTTALIAVAVVAGMGAVRALTAADVKARDSDLLQRLASEKINDVKYLADPTSGGTSGNFNDRGYSEVTWTLDDQASSVSNVDQVTVTAMRDNTTQSITTLIYVASAASSTTSSMSTSGTSGP